MGDVGRVRAKALRLMASAFAEPRPAGALQAKSASGPQALSRSCAAAMRGGDAAVVFGLSLAPRQYIVRSASVMELTAASSASTLPEPPSSSASIAASMPSKPSLSSAVSVASFA